MLSSRFRSGWWEVETATATSEPTAQHVAVAVPTSHQPLRNRLLSMLPSRSLLPTNHFGTDCSACCRRGPYFPPTTSEPTAQHVAVAVPTSHQPLRNRLLSMLPSRSLLPTNHFGTDCSACCRRGPYFPPTTSEPTAQHVAVAVPTSHQPLRNRLLSMLPSWSLLPPVGTATATCCGVNSEVVGGSRDRDGNMLSSRFRSGWWEI